MHLSLNDRFFSIFCKRMIKICYLLACSLFVVSETASTKKCDLMNVKTVLWKPSDTERICWSRNDELLLYARRVAQDLLPTKLPSDLGQLLQYFEIVWEAASKVSPNVTSSKDIIRPAIGDAIGGYLQSVALPFATEAYYAGTVNYKIIKDLHDLLVTIKVFLDTDGGGWAAPSDLSQMATKVEPIDFRSFPAQPDPFSCQKLHIPYKQCAKKPDAGSLEPSEVPALETKVEMPMLDDLRSPLAMIVPFKGKHLYSLISPCSSQVLVDYYDTSMRCIGTSDKNTVKNFNAAYYSWLSSYILPHIQQLKTCPAEWYPGFGGAMRVVDTITRNGVMPNKGSRRRATSFALPNNEVTCLPPWHENATSTSTTCLTPSAEDRKYGIGGKLPPKSDEDGRPKSVPSKSGSSSSRSWMPKIGHHSLPSLRLYYFLLPLLVPLFCCLLLYLLYLLYVLCCLPLLVCLGCRSRSPCLTDNKRQPIMTLYYRFLAPLNGGYTANNGEDMPDYDSIAAASGVSDRSLASSNKSENNCGMCRWIRKKEKTPESEDQSHSSKKKKKSRRCGTRSDASN